jgi:hypothetical protein
MLFKYRTLKYPDYNRWIIALATSFRLNPHLKYVIKYKNNLLTIEQYWR